MMKKLILILTAVVAALSMSAQDVKLLAPQKSGGMPMMQVLVERHSVRQYDSKMISEQELSDLLWAAIGVNREDGKRTYPSCRNYQEIRLFLFTAEGVSEYLPVNHSLKEIKRGDYRKLVAAGQEFVMQAPLSLVIVADMTKFGTVDERAKMMAAVDAGIVCENICLTATSLGLATVPRATMDSAKIIELLGLDATQLPIMNNPIGHAAPVK